MFLQQLAELLECTQTLVGEVHILRGAIDLFPDGLLGNGRNRCFGLGQHVAATVQHEAIAVFLVGGNFPDQESCTHNVIAPIGEYLSLHRVLTGRGQGRTSLSP
jgi:hypothetical protein